MKNRKNTRKLLLDTSFLLPTFGIEVGNEVLECLAKLAETETEIYYSNFSVLESLWIATKYLNNQQFDEQRFDLGLKSLIESQRYKLIKEDSKVFEYALKLYRLGHKDMIDNILYSNSIRFDNNFMTVDEELRKFIQNRKLNDTLVFPKEILK
ncbi:MAG: hypothetical protein QXJ17_08060 [Nitrososphaeria archaeon]